MHGRKNLIYRMTDYEVTLYRIRDALIVRLHLNHIDNKFPRLLAKTDQISLLIRVGTSAQPSTRVLSIETHSESTRLHVAVPPHGNEFPERTLDVLALIAAYQAQDAIGLHRDQVSNQFFQRRGISDEVRLAQLLVEAPDERSRLKVVI
jgi:hypothetical protein